MKMLKPTLPEKYTLRDVEIVEYDDLLWKFGVEAPNPPVFKDTIEEAARMSTFFIKIKQEDLRFSKVGAYFIFQFILKHKINIFL